MWPPRSSVRITRYSEDGRTQTDLLWAFGGEAFGVGSHATVYCTGGRDGQEKTEEFSLTAALIEGRSRAGLTQEQVATRMKTTSQGGADKVDATVISPSYVDCRGTEPQTESPRYGSALKGCHQ